MPPALRPFCLTAQFEPPTHPGGLRRLGKGLSPKSVPSFLAGWARLVSPRQRPVVASRFAGIGMGVWLVSLDAHENGPRCAQISGPTVGARQRSPAVDLLVANEGWVIVLCQDRSRRRRWPKASLYKGLSPSHARPTDGHVGVCPARGCPKGDTPERTRLVGPKNEHTLGPFA